MFSRENMKSNQKIGNIGENIAAGFLSSKGYKVLERNYWRQWGEIDIIAQKGGATHFVEVKTISRENNIDVSRKTSGEYRPEDNMHEKKIQRLHRTIQSYIAEHQELGEWQLDLIAVELSIKDKKAYCRVIENVL